MTTLQLGRAYPLEGPTLKTKPDLHGEKYVFRASHLQVWRGNAIRIWGVDEDGVWCRREYKAGKKLPKWLKRGIKKIGKV